MDQSWWRLWWLIFPLMWFVFGILQMLSRHHRQKDVLQLLRTYAEQGKEPPTEVLKVLQGRNSGADRWVGGCRRPWNRVVILASLSVGFGVMSFIGRDGGPERGFIFPAVILGVLALGFLVIALMQPKPNDPG